MGREGTRMNKFKIGDEVKIVYFSDLSTNHNVGEIGIIFSVHHSYWDYIVTINGKNKCFYEGQLQLIEENTMKYEVGQIITDGVYTRMILGICGKIYLVSRNNSFDGYYNSFTEKELDNNGYHLKDDPETIEIEGKKYSRTAVTECLKELYELA